jgi:UDP:flavonoid glycosyltransferase YjiC (YdhE family)
MRIAIAVASQRSDALVTAAGARGRTSPLRILFTFAGGTGHFLPLVPIARAAEVAGHVVAFAGQAGMVPTVEAAGFEAFDTRGASLLVTSKRTALLEFDAEREAHAVRDGYARRIAGERAAALLPLCGEWKPDIVVSDEMDFGAMVIAERLGLPHASVLCIAAGSLVTIDLVTEPLNELRAEHGLPPDPELAMLRRYLILSPFPPGVRDPGFPLPPVAHALRPTSPEAPTDGESLVWLSGLTGAPIVYFTLGTIFNLESGDLFERVLAGLGELPIYVVVTVGRELDPQVLGPQPSNVRIERYIPQSLLLPHCNLVVSHAGSGSVMGALSHGLPMVLIPVGADQPLNAARCEHLGVARVLDAVRATPDSVREATSEVLAEPTYRRNAERIRDEIAAMPSPERAVRLLERLAAERAPLLSA